MKILVYGHRRKFFEFPRERIVTFQSICEQNPYAIVIDPIQTKEDAIRFVTTKQPVIGTISAFGEQYALEKLAELLVETDLVVDAHSVLCVPAVIYHTEDELNDGQPRFRVPDRIRLRDEWLGRFRYLNQVPKN